MERIASLIVNLVRDLDCLPCDGKSEMHETTTTELLFMNEAFENMLRRVGWGTLKSRADIVRLVQLVRSQGI